jgi:hypothetical protein
MDSRKCGRFGAADILMQTLDIEIRLEESVLLEI